MREKSGKSPGETDDKDPVCVLWVSRGHQDERRALGYLCGGPESLKCGHAESRMEVELKMFCSFLENKLNVECA